MNFIKNIFCRKTKNEETDDVFQDTQDPENDHLKIQGGLQKINEEFENEQITDLQYKRIALHALKKKKRYEKQLRDIDNTLSTLAIQRDELQNFQVETTVMSALNASLDALDEILKNVNIEMADKSDLEFELEQLEEKELNKFPDVKPLDVSTTAPNISVLEDIEINY